MSVYQGTKQQLAKQGSEDAILAVAYQKTPVSHVKLQSHRHLLTLWQAQWTSPRTYRRQGDNEHQNGRQTFPLVPSIKHRLQARDFIPDHYLTMLLSGHGQCFYYYWKHLKTADSPSCECGADQQTMRHLVLECHLFADIRSEYPLLSNRLPENLLEEGIRDDLQSLCKRIMNRRGYRTERQQSYQ